MELGILQNFPEKVPSRGIATRAAPCVGGPAGAWLISVLVFGCVLEKPSPLTCDDDSKCLPGQKCCGDKCATRCEGPIVIEPLRIINWSPSHGAFCVGIDTAVSATFSADLDPETVMGESFFLQDAAGDVLSTLVYEQPFFTIRLTPSEPLEFGRLYTVTATSDIESLEWGPLAVDLDSSFMTVAPNGCAPGEDCLLPSDCPGAQICSIIGTCIDECVTDEDCYTSRCLSGVCVSPDGGSTDGGPQGD